jgi:cytochrome bd-type quinol oxidase subunit 2
MVRTAALECLAARLGAVRGALWLLFSRDGLAARMVALVGICAGLLVLTYASRAVLNERMRSIDRRQLHVVLPAFLVYMLLMLYVFPRAAHIATPWLKAMVALSPTLPLAFVAWALVRYVDRCDELERRQHLEAAGIAVIVVSLGCMSLGFLGAAKLIAVNGVFVLLMVLPALCVMYGLACTWSKWRNRAR